MKAVILAAGMGTRFGTLIPKPLTSVINEKTILDFQLEKLPSLVGENNIFLVVGYKKEIIMEAHPEIIYIYMDAYAHTNTSKGLLVALEKLDDDIVWLNGDVFFDLNVLQLLKDSKYSACLVDRKKCGDEEIKYTLDDNGFIKYLSKEVKDGLGEAIGINLIKRQDRPAFIDALKEVQPRDYFEKALENLTLANKIKLRAIDIGSHYCQEIDFDEDLTAVQNYLKLKPV